MLLMLLVLLMLLLLLGVRLELLGQGRRRLSHGRLAKARAQVVQVFEEHVHLILKRCDVRRHLLVFGRVLEAIAAIGRVDALQVQVTASLARCLAIALDLAPFALIAAMTISLCFSLPLTTATHQASEIYLLLLDLPPGPCWLSSAFLLFPFALSPGLPSYSCCWMGCCVIWLEAIEAIWARFDSMSMAG